MQSILIVTTAAPTGDLTVLATVKEELGITSRENDAMLGRWISEESDTIARYCGRTLAQESVTETFRLPRPSMAGSPQRHELQLARWPVVSIASITEDDCAPLTEGVDFEVNYAAGQVFRLCGTTGHRQPWHGTVAVAYVGGYALLAGLPRQIEKACILLVRHRWAARGRDPMLRSQEITGVISQTFWVGAVGDNGALPPEVEDLLTAFRDIPT